MPAAYRVFFQQFIQQRRATGAVLPSARPLASALCRYVGQGAAPQRILEVGPGTGAVTLTLVQRMRDGDTLCLVEINGTFVRYLRRALSEQPVLRRVANRIDVVHGRVEDLPGSGYDLVISGLPLSNFTAAEVTRILDGFGRLLKPGGILSFFGYIAVRSAKRWVSLPTERERLRAIDCVVGRMLAAGEFRRDWVWRNVPPAWVHHVRFAPGRGHRRPVSPVAGP